MHAHGYARQASKVFAEAVQVTEAAVAVQDARVAAATRMQAVQRGRRGRVEFHQLVPQSLGPRSLEGGGGEHASDQTAELAAELSRARQALLEEQERSERALTAQASA